VDTIQGIVSIVDCLAAAVFEACNIGVFVITVNFIGIIGILNPFQPAKAVIMISTFAAVGVFDFRKLAVAMLSY